jgi:PAS domain S-box-containing protein
MGHDKQPTSALLELRKKAEKVMSSQPDVIEGFSEYIACAKELRELQLHKIELEMQNEELNNTIHMLEEHQERIHNIVQKTPAGYFRINLDGRFLEVNDAWLRMHGYSSPDEIVGQHFSITQVEEELERALKHVTDLLSGTSMPIGEFKHKRKDGSIGYHVFSAHPIVHLNKIVGLEWYIVDKSDQIKTEVENKELLQKFYQAQKMESLGLLAGGIAHDFNNILAIIMGYCSLIEIDYDTAKEHIPAIKLASERAAGLCRQMLTYAGKGTFVLVSIRIEKLVNEMAKLLKATIKHNIVLKTRLPAAMPKIKGDDNQIRQIIMNLIINASEAIGEARGEILVSLSIIDIKAEQEGKDHFGNTIPPGGYACLEVTDSGCGMDEDTQHRIFEPFYTTKFTGRGLGMSAVLGIVSAHNGMLQLHSKLGQGTTFKVYFPIVDTEYIGDKQPAPTVKWHGSGTILLVEDEVQVKIIAKQLLEHLGFIVIEASNGEEALDAYHANHESIILVLTDMGMPVMDGYALIRELKKLKPELPIIISSGFGDADFASQIAGDDVAGLISKPYTMSQLQLILKKVLNGMH